jgi:hypothetical protein
MPNPQRLFAFFIRLRAHAPPWQAAQPPQRAATGAAADCGRPRRIILTVFNKTSSNNYRFILVLGHKSLIYIKKNAFLSEKGIKTIA